MLEMVRRFPMALLCVWAGGAYAQGPLVATVFDTATGQALPYASVASKATGETVITNAEGVFRFASVQDDDTLVFSYLGYQRLQLPAKELRLQAAVRMVPSQTELAAVQVTGRSDSLYALVVACGRALRKTGRYGGKVYFELETRTDELPVEAIECFYNGRFHGADIEGLDLKQGRIGLLPDKGRFVVNLNTSRGFMLLHPAERNSAFPATPLQYRSPKALRRAFQLDPVSTETGLDGLYHLRFTPKDSTGAYFSGELWVDPKTAEVRSILLECDRCTRHPFQAVTPGDELQNLALRYRQTYRSWQGRTILGTVEMEYALNYHGWSGDSRMAARAVDFQQNRRMWTKGILHLYAPGADFMLPLFRYDPGQTDYRKVLAMPYDSVFWAEAPALVPTERQLEDRALFAKEGLLLGSTRMPENAGNVGRTFFESNYAVWSLRKRIALKETMSTAAYAPPVAGSTEATANQVHLVAQLYLNIDPEGAGYRTFSATVFDGFSSYCHLTGKQHTDLLLNLYFDLCEMERRSMQQALERPGLTLGDIHALHAAAQKAMDQSTGRFLKETHYGTDQRKMAQWNDKVRSALGVDNFALFGISTVQK